MQRRTDIGAGVKLIDQAHNPGEYIAAGEGFRAQILAVRPDNVDGHGHHLGDEDVNLQPLEGSDIIQKEVAQGYHDQHIPAHIGQHEYFVEGDHIIQPAVHRHAAGFGNQVFSDEVQGEINQPGAQQLQVGKAGFVQAG